MEELKEKAVQAVADCFDARASALVAHCEAGEISWESLSDVLAKLREDEGKIFFVLEEM